MIRLLVVSIASGISAFLLVYFIGPAVVSRSDIVASVAGSALYLSNVFFENMPPVVVGYISSLDLAMAALTVGVALLAVIQLVGIPAITFSSLAKWIALRLRKDPVEESVRDLPAVDMDSRYRRSAPGSEILGRGIDAIDRD